MESRTGISIVVIALFAAGATASPQAGVALPASLDLTAVRAIPVQHDGRWPPLDTVARDIVSSVTGDESFAGDDPLLVLLSWTFDAADWQGEPLIPVTSQALRQALDLPQDRTTYSLDELSALRPLHLLVDKLQHDPDDEELAPIKSKVGDVHDRMQTLHRVMRGYAILAIPDAEDPFGAWRPIPPRTAATGDVSAAWASLGAAFRADDAGRFTEASTRVASLLNSLPAAFRPDPKLMDTELRYNRTKPFRTAWQFMLAAAVLSAAGVRVRKRWFDVLTGLVLVAGFATLTYGLAMRWQIAGRIPASNMFESLLFLSWGMGFFAILSGVLLRHRVVPFTAAFMGATALILADCLPMDAFVRPIAPVLLDTVWMSIHVPMIMTSYSVLAIGVLIAHLQLAALAAAPKKTLWTSSLDSLHYWYVHVGSLLLFAGIATGSMWAASSWGRYWGWDPKEVWSLVALLAYLIILHGRLDHETPSRWLYPAVIALALGLVAVIIWRFSPLGAGEFFALAAVCGAAMIFVLPRGPAATALKSILAFWMIIMTYVGVHYVLAAGLHSYGSGGSRVVQYMYWIGGADLAIVFTCCGIHWARLPRHQPPDGPMTWQAAGL